MDGAIILSAIESTNLKQFYERLFYERLFNNARLFPNIKKRPKTNKNYDLFDIKENLKNQIFAASWFSISFLSLCDAKNIQA